MSRSFDLSKFLDRCESLGYTLGLSLAALENVPTKKQEDEVFELLASEAAALNVDGKKVWFLWSSSLRGFFLSGYARGKLDYVGARARVTLKRQMRAAEREKKG